MPATSLPEFLGGCEAFARLLQHTTASVQRLQFPYAEAALSISSALGVAVTGCKHLTSLSLLEPGYDLQGLDAAAIDMLRALRAPLRTLNLDRLLGAETETHLLDIIANFAETLEQLTVNMVYFGHYAGPGERPTFVHLRTIALEHSVLDLPTFEAAFPLLEDLKVEDGEDEFNFDDDPLAVQHAASNRDHRCATWTRLRFLSGDQNSLLGLGLSGHASSVGLFNYGIVLDSEDDGRQLAIILTGMRVEMLTLSISPCIDGYAAAVGGMHEDTQILDLTVMTHMLSSNQLSISQLLCQIPALLALRLRNLRYLRICVDGDRDIPWPADAFPAPCDNRNTRTEILHRFCRMVPRLALLTVTWEAHGWANTTFLALGTHAHAQREFVNDDALGLSLGSLEPRQLRQKLDAGPGLEEIIHQATAARGNSEAVSGDR